MAFSSSFTTDWLSGPTASRDCAISSTSSMKTTTRSTCMSSVMAVRNSPARLPPPVATNRDGRSSTNGHSRRAATARANDVFPVPGGPNRSMVVGVTTPYVSASSFSLIGRSKRCSTSFLPSAIPARLCHSAAVSRVPPQRSTVVTSTGRSGSYFS